MAGRSSYRAAQARSEREAARIRRELLAMHKQMHAENELARARYDVSVFENYLSVIVSLHKDAWSKWDWWMLSQNPPPSMLHLRSAAAADALSRYVPKAIDRALGRDTQVRAQLQADLSRLTADLVRFLVTRA